MTKTPSATWGSADGTLVLYVQYDDSAVSQLRLPRIADSLSAAGAARAGFLQLPTNNASAHIVFPDQVTVRYPTV